MKRVLIAGLLAIAMVFSCLTPAAWAGDAASGKNIFAVNCAACHAGGLNAVNPAKTLQKSDLDKYGMNSLAAVVSQVTNGKNAMPGFAGRLSGKDIEDVATYVLAQSEQGW
ncbi:MAG: c-type cytochrome [Cyanothece sp. SIO1E1]|nr:c-type cytochrome [Cyanothece sp. SIO1E1]